MMSHIRREPKWYQFRLTSLLVLMTVVSAASWAYVHRAYVESQYESVLQVDTMKSQSRGMTIITSNKRLNTDVDWTKIARDGLILLTGVLAMVSGFAWLNTPRSNRSLANQEGDPRTSDIN